MPKKIDPPKAPEKIAPSAIEISVARNGFLKPYSICFQHLPDNIAREPLGLLAGVMIIGDRSENSAYIVNFLASIAKKEYYGNPRRDAVESFEASLHKINIGLAELAKEGNTEWIGTLDAALCAVEGNNLHFSVAGKARVLLFRDHRLSDISDGLVNGSDDHPMKTFTDVASGKISSGDRILITTPELFLALSEAELERSANRLSGEQFERFLQTAIVNKLDLSVAVLINIGTTTEYERRPAPKRTLATLDSVPNAWSHAIFEASRQHGNSIEDGLKERKETERERTDDKTGHIYVTGETLGEESNETWEHIRIFLGDSFRSIRHTGKILKNQTHSGMVSGMQSIGHFLVRLAATIQTSFRIWRQKRNIQRVLQGERQKETPLNQQKTSETREESLIILEETRIRVQKSGLWSEYLTRISEKTIRGIRTFPRLSLPSLPKEISLSIPAVDGSALKTRLREYFRGTQKTLALLAQKIAPFLQALSQKQKLFLLLALGIAAFIVALFFFFK